MKWRIAIVYGVVAFIAYIAGFSRGARNYVEHDLGMRVDSFHPHKVLGITDDAVVVEGEVVTRGHSGVRKATRDANLMMPLHFEGNECPMRLTMPSQKPSASAIVEIKSESATEFREAVRKLDSGVYFTNPSYTGGAYVADTRNPVSIRIIPVSYSTGFSRDQRIVAWMPAFTVIAHLFDLLTAPIQLLIFLLALLSPMSHWK